MKRSTKQLLMTGLVSLTVGSVQQAQAQDTIGFDDYNTAVIGTDYVSRTFTPDLANANGGGNLGVGGNTGFGGNPSPTPGSFFDLWGVAQRDNGGTGPNGEPNDVFDDSAGSFPPDVIGFNSIGTDGFVVVSDTVNGLGAPAQLDYVFDIAGYENIQVRMDWGAFGDFESNDSFFVQAGINGGAKSTIMNIGMTSAQDDANDTYTLTMASGTIADIYFDPFYNSTTWNNLDQNGAQPGVVGYHPLDNGLDGDTTANDGFIPEPTALNPENETRAYANLVSGFNDQQVQAYTDPLRASSNIDGFSTEVVLNNILQTITADVTGTGDTLELRIIGVTAGSVEYIIFDNIEIIGDLINGPLLLIGDADNDGDVDAFDISAVEQNFGTTGINDGTLLGDADDDGDVDAFDISSVEQNFGSTLPLNIAATSFSAVPEPSSLALLGLGGLLIARRRRYA